jgi:catechol 2,3-dioxygenase-like lactoylglutathione lyase family enzyme
MSSQEVRSNNATSSASVTSVDMKLEVIVIPVSDVDRAREFYSRLGWRLDADRSAGNGLRLIQFTPPGSASSIQFGVNLTSVAPGSSQGLLLAVSDIETAHQQLVANHVQASEIFHCEAETACRFPGVGVRVSGATARASQLQFLCLIQRSGWQQLVAAGSHETPSGACYRRHDICIGA